MTTIDVKLYPQQRSEEFLADHPVERWRCDILAEGGDHHGVGATAPEALMRAAQQWRAWELRRGA